MVVENGWSIARIQCASLYLKIPAENLEDAESNDIPSKLRVILWEQGVPLFHRLSRLHTQRSLLSFIINSTLNYLCMLWLVLEEAYAVYKMSGYDERSHSAQLRPGEIMEGGRFPIPSSPLCVLKL